MVVEHFATQEYIMEVNSVIFWQISYLFLLPSKTFGGHMSLANKLFFCHPLFFGSLLRFSLISFFLLYFYILFATQELYPGGPH